VNKIFLLAILISSASLAALAQHDHSSYPKSKSSNSYTTTNALVVDVYTQKQFTQLLSSYLNIKNALVTGDATSASTNADQFLRTANTIDYKVISEGNIHILSKDAGKISEIKDLKKQRDYFATLSSNMIAVAKAFKLKDKPIYVQYCPMKKSSWLSLEKGIRNPYYGSSMLTCGDVTETL
jgi:hypothetical protein